MVMNAQDREWVRMVVQVAMIEMAKELPKNCPMIKGVKKYALGIVIGAFLSGVGTPVAWSFVLKLLA